MISHSNKSSVHHGSSNSHCCQHCRKVFQTLTDQDVRRQWRMKSKRASLSYRPYSQVNPSQVIFRSLMVSEIPGGFRNSQSCDADFTHVDTLRGVQGIFILHENIHAMRVVTLSTEELGTMSKTNLRGITLGKRP